LQAVVVPPENIQQVNRKGVKVNEQGKSFNNELIALAQVIDNPN
jgi:hypothetical protein